MRRCVARGLLASLLAAPVAAQAGPNPSTDSAAVRGRDLRVEVGGYGSFRYELSDEVEGSFSLRRVAVTADARWGDRFQAYSELGYEPRLAVEAERGDGGLTLVREDGPRRSEIAVAQAWGQIELGPIGARFGAILPPVGRFNLHHHDVLSSFPRRPLVDGRAQVLPIPAVWTEMGLGLVGEHGVGAEGVLSWQAYLVNGVTLAVALEEKVLTGSTGPNRLSVEARVRPTQGAFDGSNPADGLTGRIAFRPAPGSELALSGYTAPYTPDFLDASARLSTVGMDGRAWLGPVIMEGELLHTRYSRVDEVVTNFARVARDQATGTTTDETTELETEIRIVLTGLADSRTGFWLDLAWPFALRPGTLGFASAVLTPVARYERVWLERALGDFKFTGGRIDRLVQADRDQDRFAAGLAFRPLPQAVIQLVYERNQAHVGPMVDPAVDDESTNGVVVGLAVGF
jgi:hypothetical protein